jgi:hypothetical protein
MAKNYGTLQLLDTLATIDRDNVFTYGEDRLYRHIRDLLNAHNRMTRDLATFLVDYTTDNIRRFGAQPVQGEMVEVDEYGAADVQKTAVTGYDIGFPLRGYQYALGWTKKYFEVKTVADIAKEYVAAQNADIRNIKRRVLNAFFRATNYNFIDRLTNSQTLPVKALINADGSDIPYDEFGNSFDGSTHTHLVGHGGAYAAADITALINNVKEHGVNGGQIVLLCNTAQEAGIAAFTSNFDGLQAPMIDPGPGSTADVVRFRRNNPYQADDRPIGIWDGYVVVWTKPWIPAGYIVAIVVGGANESVLEYRTRKIRGYGNFRLVGDHDHYPLRATHFEREFGVGVWNRLGAAILDTANSAYTQPTIGN